MPSSRPFRGEWPNPEEKRMFRKTTEKPRQEINTLLGSANRDPAQFPDPDRLIVEVFSEKQLERAIEIDFRSGGTVEGGERGRYRDGWLKLFSDGAVGSRTAAMLQPYEPDERLGPPPGGASGMSLRSHEQLADLAGRAAEHGIASEVHAIGDATGFGLSKKAVDEGFRAAHAL